VISHKEICVCDAVVSSDAIDNINLAERTGLGVDGMITTTLSFILAVPEVWSLTPAPKFVRNRK
jgi:uncharacterized membrane protein YkgB